MDKQRAGMQKDRTAATAKVVFTQGALKAINQAIKSLERQRDEIVSLHEAVKEEALSLAEEPTE